MFRLYFSIFWNKPPEGHPHKMPLVESIPLVILALGAPLPGLFRSPG
jgi:NADH:ubiquinone oxidoreductase subunit 5 (subunit L)/multisubunit Na+/H+ antiporter MnhA subunit